MQQLHEEILFQCINTSNASKYGGNSRLITAINLVLNKRLTSQISMHP